MPTSEPWQEDLIRYLVGGGTQGRKQSEIVVRFKNRTTSGDIENELKALWAEYKVDRYTVPAEGPRSGRPSTVWRATSKIHHRGDVGLSIPREEEGMDNRGGKSGDDLVVLDDVSIDGDHEDVSHDENERVPSRKKARVQKPRAKTVVRRRGKAFPRGRSKGK